MFLNNLLLLVHSTYKLQDSTNSIYNIGIQDFFCTKVTILKRSY